MQTVRAEQSGHGLKIAIIRSRFNEPVGEGLLKSCHAALLEAGVRDEDVTLVEVAGALEIPLVISRMAQKGGYDAFVALGAVVRGETYHFEIVSNEMASGITRVQLDHGVPVANGVLTTENDEQAMARVAEKGRDCALVAVEMARLLEAVA